jgi:hypothetical protein
MTIVCRAPFAREEELGVLALGFLDHSLPKECWTNDAHWAGSLWLLRHRPDIVLERDLPDLIRAFNLAKGGENTDTAGYHETITQASIHIIRLFAAHGASACATVNRLLASSYGRKDWFFDHWSKDVLMSPAARRAWVAPDVKALPLTIPC